MGNYIAHYKFNLLDWVLFGLLYGFVWLLSLLPFFLIYRLSDLCFFILYYVVGYRKKVTRRNLHHSFPEKDEAELRKIERRFYHYFCDYIFETIKLATMTRRTMMRRMKFSGMQHIYGPLERGHNVALYLAHYCNWEWVTGIMLHLPQTIYGGQVYHVLQSKVMDRLMLTLRSRMGTINIPMHELLRRIIKVRKEGQQLVLGFISDQGPEMFNIHYWTTFLHQETAIIDGTETVARKCDFACVYLDIRRIRRGHYAVEVLPLEENPASTPEFTVTEQYARALERNIQRQPEFWLWTHNRWKRTRQMHEAYLSSTPKERKG